MLGMVAALLLNCAADCGESWKIMLFFKGVGNRLFMFVRHHL
jgi:hypothetical protein